MNHTSALAFGDDDAMAVAAILEQFKIGQLLILLWLLGDLCT